jgi:hypothetical protein
MPTSAFAAEIRKSMVRSEVSNETDEFLTALLTPSAGWTKKRAGRLTRPSAFRCALAL